VDGARPIGGGFGPAHGLAVVGDDMGAALLPGALLRGRRPRRKPPLQRLRIDQAEHFAKGLGARHAGSKGQRAPQPIQARTGVTLHPLSIIGPANHAHQRRQQDLVQRICDHAGHPMVGSRFHLAQKTQSHRTLPDLLRSNRCRLRLRSRFRIPPCLWAQYVMSVRQDTGDTVLNSALQTVLQGGEINEGDHDADARFNLPSAKV
jgi:hypothetical protein